MKVQANTLDKYLKAKADGSLPRNVTYDAYNAMSKKGEPDAVVPVFSHGHLRATWPLTEEYAATMLLLHDPRYKDYSHLARCDFAALTSHIVGTIEGRRTLLGGVSRMFRGCQIAASVITASRGLLLAQELL